MLRLSKAVSMSVVEGLFMGTPLVLEAASAAASTMIVAAVVVAAEPAVAVFTVMVAAALLFGLAIELPFLLAGFI